MKLPIIINEAGKIYIEAVPQLGWGKAKECTFAGALESVFAVTSTPFTYEDLLGWSGLAFRTRWFQGDRAQRWCPSSPVGEGDDEINALRRATGYELPCENRVGRTPACMEEFAPRIVAEIRAGRPVFAYGKHLNMAVIFGFEDQGRILLMRDYLSDDPQVRIPIEDLGPFIGFLGERANPLPPRDALLESLRRGVEGWHGGSVPLPGGRYWVGRAALVKWREELENAGALGVDARRLLFFVNWWVFDCLVDARAAVVKYLRRNSGLLHGSALHHLQEALAAFAEESRILRATMADKQMFLGPWSGRAVEHWTDTVRHREAVFLSRLPALEAEAFGELENLLTAADAPLPATELSTLHA